MASNKLIAEKFVNVKQDSDTKNLHMSHHDKCEVIYQQLSRWLFNLACIRNEQISGCHDTSKKIG